MAVEEPTSSTNMSTVWGMHVRIPPPAPNTPAGREVVSSREMPKIDHEKVCMVEPLSCGGFSQNIARLYVLPAILNYEFSVGPVSANSMTISAVVSGFPTVPAVLVSPQVAGSRARPFSRSNSGDRNYLHHMSGYWMF